MVIFYVIALIIGGLFAYISISNAYRKTQPEALQRSIIKAVVFVVALLVLAGIIDSAVFVVQAGEVGVIKRFGAVVEGTFDPGIHFKIPLVDDVVIFSTIKKTYETSLVPESSLSDYPDIIITANTADGQEIKMGVTARFMIDPAWAPWILAHLGNERNYVESIVKTEVRNTCRRVPNKYAASMLYTSRSYDAQQEMYNEIGPKFAANHIILDEFNIRQIDFTENYKTAIENKQIAMENITTERNKAEQAKYMAEQQVTRAQGEATAINIKQDALSRSDAVIRWEAIQKLNPNVKVMVVDTKTGMLMDVSRLVAE
jgi:regulator of protease activity HflC (stomatin/prohibitin superfamily)